MTDSAGIGEVFLLALGLSTVVGLAVGWLGARLLAWSAVHGWVSEEWRRVPALMFAGLGYAVTVSLDGSGFITAWVAGLAFGVVWRRNVPPTEAATAGPRSVVGLSEELGDLLASLELLRVRRRPPRPRAVDHRLADRPVRDPQPDRGPDAAVALALAGSHFRLPTVLYIGWFGPRGLASIVFALLMLHDGPPAAEPSWTSSRSPSGSVLSAARRIRGLGRRHLRHLACHRGRGRSGLREGRRNRCPARRQRRRLRRGQPTVSVLVYHGERRAAARRIGHAPSKLLRRILPGAAELTHYRRKWLHRDLLAGLAVRAILVPQGLAYGELAGLSPWPGSTPHSRPCSCTP